MRILKIIVKVLTRTLKYDRLLKHFSAGVVKLVYTLALGAGGAIRGGSSPLSGTYEIRCTTPWN